MIEARNIVHSYEGETVLREVDWSLGSGDRWAVLGPSGAGKTTLARIVSGYEHPNDDGTVTINGEDRPNLAKWRRSVGWLSTDLLDRIPSRQSVLDTVVAGKHSQTLKAERSGLNYSDRDEERAESRLADVGLEDRAPTSFGNLSQGQRQLVLVARALMDEPDLLVLDEPCAGLDPGAREKFLTRLDAFLRGRGDVTVIYVTHHVEEILPAFDRLLVVEDGRVRYSGSTGEFLGGGRIEGVYSTDFELRKHDGRYWPVGTAE